MHLDVRRLLAQTAEALEREGHTGRRLADRLGDRQPLGGVDADVPEHLPPGDVVGDRTVRDDADPAVPTDVGPEVVHPAQGPGGDDHDADALLLDAAQHLLGARGEPALAVEQGAVEIGGDQPVRTHGASSGGNHRASSVAAPSSWTVPVTASAASRTTSTDWPIATPRPAHSSISMSLRPSPIASTSAASRPSSSATRRRPDALLTPTGARSSQAVQPTT